MIFQSYVSMLYIRIDVWRALQNFAMVNFEESIAEMIKTTREAAVVATESDGDETGNETGGPGDETATRWRQRLVTRRRRPVG